jgi:hypothetical protein
MGHRWFELKAFIASSPFGKATSPRTARRRHLTRPSTTWPVRFGYSAQFSTPTYSYLTPVDERNASADVLNNTPCASPGVERRCLGNVAQSCQSAGDGQFFGTVQNSTATSCGGNFVEMCQRSTGECCTSGSGNKCQ